jgi:hypothetical protein
MVRLKYFFMERKMFEEHVTIKILTFIEPQEGARDPDRRLDQDPGYAFQGVKISCVPELTVFKNWLTRDFYGFLGLSCQTIK